MVLIRAGNDESRCLFVATSENVKTLHSVLKAIQFRERSTICISPKGIKVTVEDTKCVQASAFLQTDLFTKYQLNEENVNFCISLPVLCECLNIFGAHSNSTAMTTVKISYAAHGQPLRVILEESGIVTDCTIRTLEPDEMMDFEFSLATVAAKIIMKAEPIRETFGDLDTTSECMEIAINPDRWIKFSTKGVHCTSEATVLKESEHMELFSCANPLKHKYRVTLLKPISRALMLATKISMRFDDRGFLTIQFMVEHNGQIIFIEFFCSPQEDDEVSVMLTPAE